MERNGCRLMRKTEIIFNIFMHNLFYFAFVRPFCAAFFLDDWWRKIEWKAKYFRGMWQLVELVGCEWKTAGEAGERRQVMELGKEWSMWSEGYGDKSWLELWIIERSVLDRPGIFVMNINESNYECSTWTLELKFLSVLKFDTQVEFSGVQKLFQDFS